MWQCIGTVMDFLNNKPSDEKVKFEKLKEENETLKKRQEVLNASNGEVMEHVNFCYTKMEGFNQLVNKLRQELHEKTGENNVLKERCQALSASAEGHRVKIKSHEDESKLLIKGMEEMTDRHDALKKNVKEDLRKQAAFLHEKHESLMHEMRALHGHAVEKLEQKNKHVREKHDALRESFRQIEEDLHKERESCLRDRESLKKMQSVASSSAEVLAMAHKDGGLETLKTCALKVSHALKNLAEG